MEITRLKNKISSYNDGFFIYDHIKYSKAFSPSFAYDIHDVCEVLFLKAGNITYTVEGRSYETKKDTLIFTRPGDRHNLYFNDDSAYERHDILFDTKILSPGVYEKIPRGIDVIDAADYPLIDEIFQKMDYYCKCFEGDDLKNILTHLTEEIIYNIILMDKVFSESVEATRYSANPTVIKALGYIEKNISRNFSLDDLCNELFITKSHLHRLFSEHLEITPKKYINSKRLILAQKLLRRGEKPASVFTECGFTEYSTFWRDYKKYFGYSPSEENGREVIRKNEF